MLVSLSINTSNLQDNPLRIIILKDIMKKGDEISMDIEYYDGRERKKRKSCMYTIYDIIVSNRMSKILILYNKL